MRFEIIFEQDLVDKTDIAVPVVFWPRLGHRNVEFEIRKFLFNLAELILVKNLIGIACAIPIRNFASRLKRMEEMKEMRTEWRHASAATDINHFTIGILNEKLAEGT